MISNSIALECSSNKNQFGFETIHETESEEIISQHGALPDLSYYISPSLASLHIDAIKGRIWFLNEQDKFVCNFKLLQNLIEAPSKEEELVSRICEVYALIIAEQRILTSTGLAELLQETKASFEAEGRIIAYKKEMDPKFPNLLEADNERGIDNGVGYAHVYEGLTDPEAMCFQRRFAKLMTMTKGTEYIIEDLTSHKEFIDNCIKHADEQKNEQLNFIATLFRKEADKDEHYVKAITMCEKMFLEWGQSINENEYSFFYNNPKRIQEIIPLFASLACLKHIDFSQRRDPKHSITLIKTIIKVLDNLPNYLAKQVKRFNEELVPLLKGVSEVKKLFNKVQDGNLKRKYKAYFLRAQKGLSVPQQQAVKEATALEEKTQQLTNEELTKVEMAHLKERFKKIQINQQKKKKKNIAKTKPQIHSFPKKKIQPSIIEKSAAVKLPPIEQTKIFEEPKLQVLKASSHHLQFHYTKTQKFWLNNPTISAVRNMGKYSENSSDEFLAKEIARHGFDRTVDVLAHNEEYAQKIGRSTYLVAHFTYSDKSQEYGVIEYMCDSSKVNLCFHRYLNQRMPQAILRNVFEQLFQTESRVPDLSTDDETDVVHTAGAIVINPLFKIATIYDKVNNIVIKIFPKK